MCFFSRKKSTFGVFKKKLNEQDTIKFWWKSVFSSKTTTHINLQKVYFPQNKTIFVVVEGKWNQQDTTDFRLKIITSVGCTGPSSTQAGIGLYFNLFALNWRTSLILLVKWTNFHFYTILIQLEIAELAIAKYIQLQEVVACG